MNISHSAVADLKPSHAKPGAWTAGAYFVVLHGKMDLESHTGDASGVPGSGSCHSRCGLQNRGAAERGGAASGG